MKTNQEKKKEERCTATDQDIIIIIIIILIIIVDHFYYNCADATQRWCFKNVIQPAAGHVQEATVDDHFLF